MRETCISAALLHRDHPDCPANAHVMMADAHRVGCSNGRTCPAPREQGGTARAVFYARHTRTTPDGKREARAMYFCAHCAKAFAHRFGLVYDEPAKGGRC